MACLDMHTLMQAVATLVCCCVTWAPPFILFGQIDPQLKPPQIPLCNLGHSAVHNASPSSHPLHTPRTNHPLWKTTGSCLVCACGGLAVCCYAEKVLFHLYMAIAGHHE